MPALTNAPNLDIATLHHSTGADMDLLATLRQAMGLPDTADQPAVVTAVTAMRTAAATHAQQLADIARAAGVKDGADAAGIATALQARGGQGLQEAVALQSRIQELEQGVARSAAERAIDAAMAAGKPIPPGSREEFRGAAHAGPGRGPRSGWSGCRRCMWAAWAPGRSCRRRATRPVSTPPSARSSR